jgi:hypothetical protein
MTCVSRRTEPICAARRSTFCFVFFIGVALYYHFPPGFFYVTSVLLWVYYISIYSIYSHILIRNFIDSRSYTLHHGRQHNSFNDMRVYNTSNGWSLYQYNILLWSLQLFSSGLSPRLYRVILAILRSLSRIMLPFEVKRISPSERGRIHTNIRPLLLPKTQQCIRGTLQDYTDWFV